MYYEISDWISKCAHCEFNIKIPRNWADIHWCRSNCPSVHRQKHIIAEILGRVVCYALCIEENQFSPNHVYVSFRDKKKKQIKLHIHWMIEHNTLYIVIYHKIVWNICRYHARWRYDDDSTVFATIKFIHMHTAYTQHTIL